MNSIMLLCAVVDGTPEDVNKVLMVQPNYPMYVKHAHINNLLSITEEIVCLRTVEFGGIIVGRVGKCSCGQIIVSLP